MKFKEQRGNVFIFDGGHAGGELELTYHPDFGWYEFKAGHVLIDKDLDITSSEYKPVAYTDIQTAVNLMQILIKEGLV